MSCQNCHNHNHNHGQCSANQEHSHTEKLRPYLSVSVSASLFLAGILLSHLQILPDSLPSLLFFLVAVAPVAKDVIEDAVRLWRHADFMNEYTLMLAASVGAFIIGEYPEGVAVLLFYCFGEKLEDSVSDKVRNRIKSLIAAIPDSVILIKNGVRVTTSPKDVTVGNTIAVLPGQRVPLDGTLLSEHCSFDTSAITGEPIPAELSKGATIKSGTIPVDSEALILTTTSFSDSSMTRIMKLIEDASASKSPTENLLRRITRFYTPIVFLLALLLIAIPYLISLITPDYTFQFSTWFRRSLIFLVCSCPCALVVSVPLSYFMAIGKASSAGILFKGSRYIDALLRPFTILLDKTGTITTGKFHVTEISTSANTSHSPLALAAALDNKSMHPLAQAICEYAKENNINLSKVNNIVTIPHGIKGIRDGKEVLVGSRVLLNQHNIKLPASTSTDTEICVSCDGEYVGAIYLSDTMKADVPEAVKKLHELGFSEIDILSGDREEAVKKMADAIRADNYYASLLPEQKQDIVFSKCKEKKGTVVFVGDGINDAPALAAADVGIAMGSAGTALAMESADMVIIGDDIYKIPTAVRIARRVRTNIIITVSFALCVKAIVMILGAFGIATLWAAVFADTGVTLIAVIITILSLGMSFLNKKS
ncbi:MAG: cadmium-translocating P-type ATPase [Prevotella sp.]|nr:cadmium-translocating P-type ATPase [Bacteroides sp.]MCM1366105.1 cadmium-translocating P-type ATPase [Prevotella sp.]MCM1436590.1 cadmium-translocating P-type ATPase [Prevotella sp.]